MGSEKHTADVVLPGGHGQQPTRNMAIPPVCAAAVREVNRLYPKTLIIDFAQKGALNLSCSKWGSKATAPTLCCWVDVRSRALTSTLPAQ
jgi:hypothetical protein